MKNAFRIFLKHGREKSVLRGHPWIYSGAVAHVEGPKDAAGPAVVVDAAGQFLAHGFYQPSSALAVRLYAWQEATPLGRELLRQRLTDAAALRRAAGLEGGDTNACRLVYSESDRLSGLIVDRYGDVLSVRVGAKAIEAHLEDLRDALGELTGIQAMVFEVDAMAEDEGLDAERIRGFTTAAATRVEFVENGLRFEVDVAAGQKTGAYLDQRDNRLRVAAWAKGRRMLSAYCYAGAFEVYAARAGAAALTGIDSSGPALEQARRHLALNGLTTPAEYLQDDVPLALRKFRDQARTFDLIVLDPPRFVFHRAQLEKGMRAYKDINLLALKLLAPGGILATFSCSGRVSPAAFEEVVAWAAHDAGRPVQILEKRGQPADHPILTSCPETEYLKGLICRVP